MIIQYPSKWQSMLLCKLHRNHPGNLQVKVAAFGPEVFVVANHQHILRLFVGVVDRVEISQTFAINHTIGPGLSYQSHGNVHSYVDYIGLI